MTTRTAAAAVEAAVAAIGAGHAVVVTDATDREDEGDLVFAAEHATAELVAFTVRHGSGVVCVPMEGHRLDELALPPMVAHNQGHGVRHIRRRTQRPRHGHFATDRARTIMLLADPAAVAGDLSRPGHVLPLRARDGGVLEREGHTEAAVDLVKLAGLPRSASSARSSTTMARGRRLDAFCDQHELLPVSIEDLVFYRRAHRPAVSSPRVRMPTPHGDFHARAHRVGHGPDHLSLTVGNVAVSGPVPVRIHSECVTGDVFGSTRCDCRTQLDVALADLAARGHGVLVSYAAMRDTGPGFSTSCGSTLSAQTRPTALRWTRVTTPTRPRCCTSSA